MGVYFFIFVNFTDSLKIGFLYTFPKFTYFEFQISHTSLLFRENDGIMINKKVQLEKAKMFSQFTYSKYQRLTQKGH